MAEHIFTASQEIDLPRDVVFEFFSNAENLEKITPPALGFHILTELPIVIREGALIDYDLKLHGFPIKWRTEITKWDPPNEFVDTQLRGPYKQWIHTHRFTTVSGGRTLMEDEVRYRLPLEPFGDIANFVIERQIKGIFENRQKVVADLLLAKAAA
jgi:ligand-binding SRPBCC domain-containing protein